MELFFLDKVKQKVNRYPTLRTIYDRAKSITKIIPYYLVQEHLFDETDPKPEPRLNQCVVSFLGPSDIETIAASPDVNEPKDAMIARLANGCLCLGIKHHRHIIAYMWCNLIKCDSTLISFPLKEDEVYLTGARTFEAYRGRNLAPYLRYQLYEYLSQIGRTKFFSITELFNTPAIKFKKKLKVKPLKLYLHIILLEKFHWNILLKNYVSNTESCTTK